MMGGWTAGAGGSLLLWSASGGRHGDFVDGGVVEPDPASLDGGVDGGEEETEGLASVLGSGDGIAVAKEEAGEGGGETADADGL